MTTTTPTTVDMPPKTHRLQRGSAALEVVIGAPIFLLFIGLIVFGGRTANAHQALQTAANDSARSASIARDARTARADAEAAAMTSVRNQKIPCTDLAVDVDTSAFTLPPGRTGAVEVTVSCLLDLSDLAVPGIPGSRQLEATMTSPLDTWRERS